MPDAGNRPSDPARFPPVIFDDDTPGLGPPVRDDDGEGMLRIVGGIVLAGVLLAVLVLPPISILDRGGGASVEIDASEELPELPAGLVALSPLYAIQVSDDLLGQRVKLTVDLSEATTDDSGLALYSHDGERWRRLAPATLSASGRSAEGEVEAAPASIAVLRRTSLARGFALLVGAGETPDAAAGESAIVSVIAGSPASDAGGEIELVAEALGASQAAGHTTYIGLTARSDAAALAVDGILATAETIAAHVESIVGTAVAAGADGVHIDYPRVDNSRGASFTAFIASLAEALGSEGLPLAVSVPAPPTAEADAFDWLALTQSAQALWLRAPDDSSAYHEQVETVLEARRTGGVDLSSVWLVIDRRSRERTPDGIVAISLRDALTVASELRTGIEAGIAPGDPVTVQGVNIDRSANNSGMQWNDRALAVTYSYVARGGPRTVWIENRFSAAFRLDLVRRYGLGGVVVESAAADANLPDLWPTVVAFVQEGSAPLELPFGPYLQPRWSASDGAIEGDGANGAIVWRAPDRPGAYDITLIISDGVVFVGQQTSLRVTPGGEQEEPAPQTADAPAAPLQAAQQTATAPLAVAEPQPAPAVAPTVEPAPVATATPEPTPAATATIPPGPPGPAGN